MFSLSVFALVGLQIYMGVLSQKCIKSFNETKTETDENGNSITVPINLTDQEWFNWNNRSGESLPIACVPGRWHAATVSVVYTIHAVIVSIGVGLGTGGASPFHFLNKYLDIPNIHFLRGRQK